MFSRVLLCFLLKYGEVGQAGGRWMGVSGGAVPKSRLAFMLLCVRRQQGVT